MRLLRFFGLGLVSLIAVLCLQAGDTNKTGPVTEKRFPPLKLPPGFKATLFACDPLIEYPSVIAAGPKPGALFVAVDFMTGLGSDGKVKSEIRLIEDTDGDGYADKSTTIAQGFNSIQGLAYHDGNLLVMHAPFLTSVRVPSPPALVPEGKGRKDLLTGLGLKPEDNPSRLHCANGVVVGHDGWLYLAVGDNGVDVPRPEGDRLLFEGGGILRCRPDGRDLHVFSTGLRNIYDIALDAELNVFTRDNENDGGTYMIRVCHCFHGSDHGYPYDYEERVEYPMKPLGDFGRGSSAGGVCYLETQFPPAYRGNLFFCEWGKSVVRYELNRKSVNDTSFQPVKELEFAFGDPKDTYPFKPTDIVVQRDGTLMVADYADGQRPKRGRGRVYHIKYVGQDSGPIKEPPGPKSRITKLDSASYFDRVETQKWIEEEERVPPWSEVGKQGKGHVIWALAHLDGEKALDRLFNILQKDTDISVRVQAVRAIADLTDPVLAKHKLDAGRGDEKIAERLAAAGKKLQPRVRHEIIIALGRLRWHGTPDWIRNHLLPADATAQHIAMQALRRSGNWPGVLKLYDESDSPFVREVALKAMADRHEPAVVDGLIARFANENDEYRRRTLVPLLARAYKKPGPWKYWGYRPGPRPANTVIWERTDAIEKALDSALVRAEEYGERLQLVKHMQREKVPIRPATLGKIIADEHNQEVANVILAILKEQPIAAARDNLTEFVRKARYSTETRTAALEVLLKEKDAKFRPLLASFVKTLEDGPVLANVLRRLGQHALQDDEVAKLVAPSLNAGNPEVRAAAIWSLGMMTNTRVLPRLKYYLQDKDVRVRRAAAFAAHLSRDDMEVTRLLVKLGSDADIETRRAALLSMRSRNDPECADLAAAALKIPELTDTALMCVRDRGSAKNADAVIDIARRDARSDVLTNAVMALSEWSKPDNKLQEAIAEIQGVHGQLIRWRGVGPLTVEERQKALDAFAGKDKHGQHPKLTGLFAFRFGKVELARNDKLETPIWLAFTDVAMPAPTNVEFLGAAGGRFEVFLNGKSIHRRDKPAKFQPDSDRFEATLDKGVNRVLVQTGESFVVEFDLSFRRKSSKAEHEQLTQAALSRPGNIERGRKIFFDKEKSQCLKCHRMDDQGETIGPDLTGLGARFSRIHLIESILEPGRTIAPSYGTFAVSLKNGKTLSGVKFAETDALVTFADNQGIKHAIAKRDIDEMNLSNVSIMPDGLEKRLTAEEFVDLIGFLASQKGKH